MIRERLGLDTMLEPTQEIGQFDVWLDGERIASRGGNLATRILFGAGFPEPAQVVGDIASRRG